MGAYRDPDSDNDATNPLKSAPDDATVVALQDGHLSDTPATDWQSGERGRNKRHC